jgi:rhodanese-related sulfurtransferase
MQIRDLLTEKRLHQLEEMVAEIDVQELKKKIDNGEIFQLVEVSNPEDFKKGHLEGATNIPLAWLPEMAPLKFHKLQQIVIYCENSNSSVGVAAARILQRLGFANMLLLKGGKERWQQAGLPLESEGHDQS